MKIKDFEDLGFSILAKGETYLVANNKSDLDRWTELGYDFEKQTVQVIGAHQHEKGGTVRSTLIVTECKNATDLHKILKFVEHY